MTWVKLCAMTNIDDSLAAVRAGADAIGFVFAPSKRRIDTDTAASVIRELPPTVEKVGVFANQSADVIRDTVARAGLSAVQLHGDEDAHFARELFPHGSSTRPHNLRIIKTVHVDNTVEGMLREFSNCAGVDAILLDSVSGSERGGTGLAFPWGRIASLLGHLDVRPRIIVAGGLTPENVAKAMAVIQPWGVDVASGVEREPGSKDHNKMNAFVAAVRGAEKRS